MRSIDGNIYQEIGAKIEDYFILVKFKLSLTVVFSAAFGYLFASGLHFDWQTFLAISIGGFFITGAANAMNQVIEKDYDKLMKRTANRPLATGRMTVTEGILVAGLAAVVGISILWLAFGQLVALLGAISFFLYAFVYTPLKRVHPIAVFVGAIPGALPPMIGYVAFVGAVDQVAIALFLFQFIWQFPHFWAIGWMGFEEYNKAGFKLLPSHGKSSYTAVQIMFYIVSLSMLCGVFYLRGIISVYCLGIVVIAGAMFLKSGFDLYQKRTDKAALHVMLASVFYLTFVQVVFVVDRIFAI